MSRHEKSSKKDSSSSKSSSKKHSAVPPKGGIAEASIADEKKAAAAKTIKIALPEQETTKQPITAAKPTEAPKTAVHPAVGADQKAAQQTSHSVAQNAPTSVATGPSAQLQALLGELGSASASVRLNAATEIGKTGDRHAVSALINALNDSDADVAREAATALGHLGDRTAVDALVEILSDTNGYYHAVVRAAAASSLGQLKDTRAVDALLVALTDPIAEPSTEAIRALAALNDRRAISALIDVVRNRSGYFVASVRRAAVLGLAKFGGPEAIEQLRFVASDNWEDNVIRDEADAAVRQANA